MNVNHDSGRTCTEKVKQVLADGFDARERFVVDGFGSFRKASIGGCGLEFAVQQKLFVPICDSVHAMSFDHCKKRSGVCGCVCRVAG